MRFRFASITLSRDVLASKKRPRKRERAKKEGWFIQFECNTLDSRDGSRLDKVGDDVVSLSRLILWCLCGKCMSIVVRWSKQKKERVYLVTSTLDGCEGELIVGLNITCNLNIVRQVIGSSHWVSLTLNTISHLPPLLYYGSTQLGKTELGVGMRYSCDINICY